MNRLAEENSPYLRQHAENPVDWYPWGDEAFEAARHGRPSGVPLDRLLACHWCHVMAHESFEDEAIAAILNARFISVKVDREEHPDVDAVYMEAVQAMTGRADGRSRCSPTPTADPSSVAPTSDVTAPTDDRRCPPCSTP